MKNIFAIMMLGFLGLSNTQAATPAWSEILRDASGMVEEGHCGSFSFRINNKGIWKEDDCGEIQTGKASKTQMDKINMIMNKIMITFDSPLECDGMGVEDYYWATKVVSRSGETKIINSNEGGSTGVCTRLPDQDLYNQLEDSIRELRN